MLSRGALCFLMSIIMAVPLFGQGDPPSIPTPPNIPDPPVLPPKSSPKPPVPAKKSDLVRKSDSVKVSRPATQPNSGLPPATPPTEIPSAPPLESPSPASAAPGSPKLDSKTLQDIIVQVVPPGSSTSTVGRDGPIQM